VLQAEYEASNDVAEAVFVDKLLQFYQKRWPSRKDEALFQVLTNFDFIDLNWEDLLRKV